MTRRRRSRPVEIIWDAGECEIRVRASYYHDPGRTYGPPENCYPPETELEILATHRIDPETGTETEIDFDDFAEQAQELIREQLMEKLADDDGPDEDREYDARRDDGPRRWNDGDD